MIIKRETNQEWIDRVSEWHPHFVWFRIIDGAIVFFETLERRIVFSWHEYYWEYRLPNEP